MSVGRASERERDEGSDEDGIVKYYNFANLFKTCVREIAREKWKKKKNKLSKLAVAIVFQCEQQLPDGHTNIFLKLLPH